jgi:hypothetical protein
MDEAGVYTGPRRGSRLQGVPASLPSVAGLCPLALAWGVSTSRDFCQRRFSEVAASPGRTTPPRTQACDLGFCVSARSLGRRKGPATRSAALEADG